MISCQTFRTTIRPGSEDATVLEHLRSCDACLDFAVSMDPDFFFRSMGGGEMVPPGGVDSFVSDVMAQIRSRQTEGSAAPRLPLNGYLRAAAAVLFVIAGTAGIYRYEHRNVTPVPTLTAGTSTSVVHHRATATKAVIETYQSQNATIVEMPAASPNEAKVVMIYDTSLPADL
jgi:hypothetical protein